MTAAVETVGSVERLRTDGVSVRFGAIVAVDEVTFDVEAGELVRLIRSRPERTTLLDVISGIRPRRAGVC